MIVAIAQIAPVLLDREATLARVLDAIHNAAKAGAELLCFGESFVPAYPLWLCRSDAARFNDPDHKALFALYSDQAVVLERGDLDPVCAAAARARCSVVLGIVERPLDRGGHSLYCSRVIIAGRGPDAGRILSTHRKLMPTYEERLVWAPGDAHALVTHPVGPFRLGALNCWENWMPLARAALYAAGVDLHVMLWPGCERLTRDITRFVALESRAFVVSASALIPPQDVPANTPLRDRFCTSPEPFYDGGSCIAAPDGSWIVPPVTDREDLILADLDPARVREERQNFDPAGHYARPDVLRVQVDRTRQSTLA